MGPHHLSTLFAPSSVAVFGASEEEATVGGRVFRNLIKAEFTGELYPINPKHKKVLGQQCYKSIGDIDQPVELAVITTPANTINQILKACGKKGVKSAVVITAGFRETGARGKVLEQTMVDTAKHYGIRLVGPNCLGLMRPGIGLDATFLDVEAPKGRLALISQSGSMCTAILDWAAPHQLGFSSVISLGNAADIDFGNALDYLATDPETDAILLYVEGVQDARSLMSGLRTAARVKPIIVLKVGRHRRSAEAAVTHSGAMIGSDDVFDAALERAGVVRAMTFGQLFAAAEILSSNKRVNGNQIAIITNGGGPGVLATDRAEDLGVELASLSDKTIEALDEKLPEYWSHNNPIDLIGDAPPEAYGQAVELCLKDKGVDGVLALLTPQAMTRPEEAAAEVVKAAKAKRGKPVLACWMGETQVKSARDLLSKKHIPNFLTPERAIEAFAYLARHHLNQKLLLQVPGPVSDTREPDIEGARLIIESALSEGRELLSDTESKAIMRAFLIPSTPTLPASTPTDALVAAETVGFPVALKVNSHDISHKSDVDGVITNVMGAHDVRTTFKALIDNAKVARPDAKILGVTVEPMVSARDSRELMVGVKRDPVFGPVIVFGAGGIMAEILLDRAVALPPLNSVLAQRLIDRTRISKLLGPFRNMPAIDRKEIEKVLLRISALVCELPHVDSLDINPLFVHTEGVTAADVRISIKRPPTSPVPYSHMAIYPYPSQLVKHTHLQDGSRVTLRPIMPEDADIEQEFVRGMSPQSRYFRFMQSINELSPEMLIRFTQLDYSREMAIVAVVNQGNKRKMLGVARYFINQDNDSCEFALAVGDETRRQGVGSKLMEALMEAARIHGMRRIEGDVLSDNKNMLSLMRSLGFSIRPSVEVPGLKEIERSL